jgi:hypothetical protein
MNNEAKNDEAVEMEQPELESIMAALRAAIASFSEKRRRIPNSPNR